MSVFKVGRVEVPLEQAALWVRDYTDPVRARSKNPYAYPAYDTLDTGSGANALNDGDLLAGTLLNAAPTARAFYRFQAMAPQLTAMLESHSDQPLQDLSEAEIAEHVSPFYAILDQDRAEFGRRGQSGTKLSKILHRKRPALLCLHDKWVRLCYLGEGAPVPNAKVRSWAEYMKLVSQAMAHDIRSQSEQVATLRSAVGGSSEITDLRLLDIVAWSSRGQSRV